MKMHHRNCPEKFKNEAISRSPAIGHLDDSFDKGYKEAESNFNAALIENVSKEALVTLLKTYIKSCDCIICESLKQFKDF